MKNILAVFPVSIKEILKAAITQAMSGRRMEKQAEYAVPIMEPRYKTAITLDQWTAICQAESAVGSTTVRSLSAITQAR